MDNGKMKEKDKEGREDGDGRGSFPSPPTLSPTPFRTQLVYTFNNLLIFSKLSTMPSVHSTPSFTVHQSNHPLPSMGTSFSHGELVREYFGSLGEWVERVWEGVWFAVGDRREGEEKWEKGHESLLEIWRWIRRLEEVPGIRPDPSLGGPFGSVGPGAGCGCVVLNFPVRIVLRGKMGRSGKREVMKEFVVRGPHNLEEVLFWVWRDLFVAMIRESSSLYDVEEGEKRTGKTEGGKEIRGKKIGKETEESVMKMMKEIEDIFGEGSFEGVLKGGKGGHFALCSDYYAENEDEADVLFDALYELLEDDLSDDDDDGAEDDEDEWETEDEDEDASGEEKDGGEKEKEKEKREGKGWRMLPKAKSEGSDSNTGKEGTTTSSILPTSPPPVPVPITTSPPSSSSSDEVEEEEPNNCKCQHHSPYWPRSLFTHRLSLFKLYISHLSSLFPSRPSLPLYLRIIALIRDLPPLERVELSVEVDPGKTAGKAGEFTAYLDKVLGELHGRLEEAEGESRESTRAALSIWSYNFDIERTKRCWRRFGWMLNPEGVSGEGGEKEGDGEVVVGVIAVLPAVDDSLPLSPSSSTSSTSSDPTSPSPSPSSPLNQLEWPPSKPLTSLSLLEDQLFQSLSNIRTAVLSSFSNVTTPMNLTELENILKLPTGSGSAASGGNTNANTTGANGAGAGAGQGGQGAGQQGAGQQRKERIKNWVGRVITPTWGEVFGAGGPPPIPPQFVGGQFGGPVPGGPPPHFAPNFNPNPNANPNPNVNANPNAGLGGAAPGGAGAGAGPNAAGPPPGAPGGPPLNAMTFAAMMMGGLAGVVGGAAAAAAAGGGGGPGIGGIGGIGIGGIGIGMMGAGGGLGGLGAMMGGGGEGGPGGWELVDDEVCAILDVDDKASGVGGKGRGGGGGGSGSGGGGGGGGGNANNPLAGFFSSLFGVNPNDDDDLDSSGEGRLIMRKERDAHLDEVRERYRPRLGERFEELLSAGGIVKEMGGVRGVGVGDLRRLGVGFGGSLGKGSSSSVSKAKSKASPSGSASKEKEKTAVTGTGTDKDKDKSGVEKGKETAKEMNVGKEVEMILMKVYKEVIETMPWMKAGDVASAMAMRLIERPSKTHIATAIEVLNAFCKGQRKKLSTTKAKAEAAAKEKAAKEEKAKGKGKEKTEFVTINSPGPIAGPSAATSTSTATTASAQTSAGPAPTLSPPPPPPPASSTSSTSTQTSTGAAAAAPKPKVKTPGGRLKGFFNSGGGGLSGPSTKSTANTSATSPPSKTTNVPTTSTTAKPPATSSGATSTVQGQAPRSTSGAVGSGTRTGTGVGVSTAPATLPFPLSGYTTTHVPTPTPGGGYGGSTTTITGWNWPQGPPPSSSTLASSTPASTSASTSGTTSQGGNAPTGGGTGMSRFVWPSLGSSTTSPATAASTSSFVPPANVPSNPFTFGPPSPTSSSQSQPQPPSSAAPLPTSSFIPPPPPPNASTSTPTRPDIDIHDIEGGDHSGGVPLPNDFSFSFGGGDDGFGDRTGYPYGMHRSGGMDEVD